MKSKDEFESINAYSRYIGNAVEKLFAYECAARDIVCIEPNSATQYDFVIDYGGGLKKVQVKTAKERHSIPSGKYSLTLSIRLISALCNERYTVNNVDYFAIYVRKYDTFYLVPSLVVLDRSTQNFHFYDSEFDSKKFGPRHCCPDIEKYKEW